MCRLQEEIVVMSFAGFTALNGIGVSQNFGVPFKGFIRFYRGM